MEIGALSFINVMRPVGISHKLELLIVFDKLIDQHFSILVVYIIITCAMNI